MLSTVVVVVVYYYYCCCLQYDSSTLDLSYYTDHTKKQKRGTINLSKFIGIRPNAKIGNKEHVFAIETEDRKYILRAGDVTAKTIWLAKLCELCGQGNDNVNYIYIYAYTI